MPLATKGWKVQSQLQPSRAPEPTSTAKHVITTPVEVRNRQGRRAGAGGSD